MLKDRSRRLNAPNCITMICTKVPVNLTADETALIKLAIVKWNSHTGFSDEQVAEVKHIFSRIFHVDAGDIQGLRFPDGMVMQPRDTEMPKYYAILEDAEDGWTGILVQCEMVGIQQFCGNTTPFSLHMAIMKDSEAYHMARKGQSDEEEEEIV